MSNSKINPRNTVVLLMIIVIAAIRLFNNFSTNISVLANYSPLAAMALFGSAYFKGNVRPLLFPLMAIFISDVVLFTTVYKDYGNGFLYDGWVWVYGAFLVIAVSAKLIIRKISVPRIAAAVITAVLIHWLVTDFGVWLGSKTYAQTWSGFMACLAAAIPFELRLLTATIIYSTIMFGIFELMQRKYVALKAM
ncbi:hypothetical protein I5907_08465 [Panacibacter sp. DH6]|uniref:Uncharacterized protein n=1 Tax=Panacibacter microcysteis TaxID=2793269 RepID=A0A931E6A5_9BACT|nr:DUF6580 family putative transport protein [Panacibacter microcysteis]MBG9376266.1 hypothetical protein [Panacibacter microcysteis]